MVDEITYTVAPNRYFNGNRYQGLKVINFKGPSGKRVSAYSGIMNLDADGEPQCYAPIHKLKPLNPLGDAGWLDEKSNKAQKATFDANMDSLKKLQDQLKEQTDKSKQSTPPGQPSGANTPKAQSGSSNTSKPQGASAPAKSADQLKAEIAALKNKIPYWHDDPNQRPKNFGKIFWDWYGVVSLSPEEAQKASFLEISSMQPTLRKPNLANKGGDQKLYEDVNGKFPVIQSIYEPGPGYFVSQIPSDGFGAMNSFFPKWDQRYYLSPHKSTIGRYAAVSPAFTKDTGVDKKDICVAIRPDNGMTSSFPFRDASAGHKVGECSIKAFESVGGALNPNNINASNNDFRLLYLAFPGGSRPDDVLAEFAAAPNLDDFLNLLAFIVRATKRAPQPTRDPATGRTIPAMVSEDPAHEFETWKKSGAKTPPDDVDVIKQALFGNGGYGGGLWIRKYMDAHPSLLETGLTPPQTP